MSDILKEISISKMLLARKPDTAFMFALCCQLETVIDDSISTAATNGKEIRYNPDFFLNLDAEERIFLIAHETLHCAYMHMARLEHRDPLRWNKAADYVINLFLHERGFTVIKGGLLDKKYANMSTEEVYELLDEEDSSETDTLGNDLMPNTDTEKLTQNVVSSSMQAEMLGKSDSIPADLKRYLEQLTKPKVDWKTVLKRFLNQVSKDDYSWRKPNRRMLHRGVYTPSLYSHGLNKITFAVDVSGSISASDFNKFISEVYGCFDACKPKEIEVIQWSHYVVSQDIVKSITDLKNIELKGSGGTDVNVAIDAFNKTNSQALIILSDGEFFSPPQFCPKPVIWVIFNNPRFKAPYGQTIGIKL